MISGIVNNNINEHLNNCMRNKEDFNNNLNNIEGRIQELFKKFDALQQPTQLDTSKYATIEEVNNLAYDIKDSFEYLVQTTPREITDLKNTVLELQARIDELESQKHIEVSNNVEVLPAKVKIPKLLVNVKKSKSS